MADEKNLGGRPPIYPDTEESYKKVAELCISYFEADNETLLKPPPTVTGLTLHLGFESKDTLYSYSKKDGFSYPIKRALLNIEQYHEIATAGGDKCTGNIFILKNFGWKDTQAIEHSGEVANNSPSISVRIVKEIDEDAD